MLFNSRDAFIALPFLFSLHIHARHCIYTVIEVIAAILCETRICTKCPWYVHGWLIIAVLIELAPVECVVYRNFLQSLTRLPFVCGRIETVTMGQHPVELTFLLTFLGCYKLHDIVYLSTWSVNIFFAVCEITLTNPTINFLTEWCYTKQFLLRILKPGELLWYMKITN